MDRIYEIRTITAGKFSGDIWDGIPLAPIDCFPWDESGYRPAAQAQVFVTDSAFHVRLRAYETAIEAKGVKRNDYVYLDSCLEFFFQPDPDSDKRYLNMEFNPLGVPYLSLGTDRYDRILLGEKEERSMRIQSSVTKDRFTEYKGPYWEIVFDLPFSFIEDYFGKVDFKPGKRMRGNFYKCGDGTKFPHYGCWNPIVIEKPDFHRPEFFGELRIG